MNQRIITAFFDRHDDADSAIAALVSAGIPRAQIRKTPESGNAGLSPGTQATGYDASRDEKGFWATLGDLFLPDDDRQTYVEALHRGSIMVSATVDDAYAVRAEDILEEFGTVDLDAREASWKSEGWTGLSRTTTAGAPSSARVSTGNTSEEAIPLVEEELKIGKRQVSDGRVKVRSYVVETPVSEQVSLRTERVHVEQRPVDRPIAAGEELFKDRTIEARAMSEEAVVSKTARVTGEVVITKDVGERVESVSDTVRSTKVEIDDDELTTERASTQGPRSPLDKR